MYCPQTGDFISMDDFEGDDSEPLSLNKYLYANANPVMNNDPNGHESELDAVIGMDNTLNGIMAASLPTLQPAATPGTVTSTTARVVTINIYIDSTTKPSTFDTSAVQTRLRQTLAPLLALSIDKLNVNLVDTSTNPGNLGWIYDKSPGMANDGLWDYVPGVNLFTKGWRAYSKEPILYTGWVHFDNNPTFIAGTSGADTFASTYLFNVNDQNNVAKGFTTDWTQTWTNMLAHEQIYLGTYGGSDKGGWFGGSVPSGDIRSGDLASLHMSLPVTIPPQWAQQYKTYLEVQ